MTIIRLLERMDYKYCIFYNQISSAETAIRELGNWPIRGKKVDIDFASPEVIRRFQERLDSGLGNSSVSICGSSSPVNQIPVLGSGTFKDTPVRKARSRMGEYEDGMKMGYHSGYRNDLDGDSKPMTTLKTLVGDSSPPSSASNTSRGLSVNSRDSHEGTLENHVYRRLEPGTDGQRSALLAGAKADTKESSRADKFSSGTVKIDLNCHETDSAIVTSSSDIIAVENSDTDAHSNFTGSSTSGDEKVGSLFEPGMCENSTSKIDYDFKAIFKVKINYYFFVIL